MKIIIIEDEEAGAKLLATTLKQVNKSIEVLGICEDETQTLQLLSSEPEVDAIFSDIQLTDALSFNVLKKIDADIPVVFVTAYNEYALEAFQHHGIDYVLKPFSRDDIEKAVNKLKTYKAGQSAHQTKKMQELFQYLENRQSYKNNFLVGFQDRLIPLKTEDIVCFFTAQSDVYILHIAGKSYRMSESLEQIEHQLDPEKFYRANRQFIVNKAFILDIRHYFNGRLKVKLNKETPEDIIISKAKATDFKNWLSQ
jgi:two-component system LytT family response regulator